MWLAEELWKGYTTPIMRFPLQGNTRHCQHLWQRYSPVWGGLDRISTHIHAHWCSCYPQRSSWGRLQDYRAWRSDRIRDPTSRSWEPLKIQKIMSQSNSFCVCCHCCCCWLFIKHLSHWSSGEFRYWLQLACCTNLLSLCLSISHRVWSLELDRVRVWV